MRVSIRSAAKGSFLLAFALALAGPGAGSRALAAPRVADAVDTAKKLADRQIRNLLEPLLDKYCREECRLLAIDVSVDYDTPEEVSPGFNDVDPRSIHDLAPSGAEVKMLIDEKVGPVSRSSLLEVMQQFLDTLEYPVKISPQVARFPQPTGAAGKVADLREKVTKQFRDTLDELFDKFCPERCMLADYGLETEVVNLEEAQYGSPGEFIEDGGIALRVRNVSGTLLVDDSLSLAERANIVEMAKLKTNYLKNVNLSSRTMRFPRPAAPDTAGAHGEGSGYIIGPDGKLRKTESSSSDTSNSSTNSSENRSQNSTNSENSTHNSSDARTSQSQENKTYKNEHYEKVERVENGDAVQTELKKFQQYAIVFGSAILALLLLIAVMAFRDKLGRVPGLAAFKGVFHDLSHDPASAPPPGSHAPASSASAQGSDRGTVLGKRFEIDSLRDELMGIFAQHPKVAKYVLTRVLTEEGIETTSAYIHLFGESIVIDMIRDPSLQNDLNELLEYYARTPMQLEEGEKLDLLRSLHNRTVAGKLIVMGSRSSNLFDFLVEMDGLQILELIKSESLTVKSIVLTQCDPQKRAQIYSQLDEQTRMALMTELSRIDYLPRDYIFNVATALKRKRRDNPKLNTEALPGSEVLLTLLERTPREMQRTVLKNLEMTNPDSARSVKSRLVTLDTLTNLRESQLLEVVLSLKHDELVQFLKGTPDDIRHVIFSKCPGDLVADLEEELQGLGEVARESYLSAERKVLNRVKIMAHEGQISLIEANSRMLAEESMTQGFVEARPADTGVTDIRRAA